MKRNLLLLTAVLLGFMAYSQPAITIQAYKQNVLPGMVPKGVTNEEGTPTERGNGASVQYYIYLLQAKTDSITPLQVWINKQAYKITTERVPKTPVIVTNRMIPNKPTHTTLVPKTSKKVVQWVPAGKIQQQTPAAGAKNLMQTSELVISYRYKGKIYYKGVKELKELEPLMGE